jgi:hypothetical protein
LKILDSLLLALADAVVFVIANQSVRNIAERTLNRLLVADESLPLLRLGVAQIVTQCTTFKDRLGKCRCIGSDSQWSRDIRADNWL